jgi:hypothetical protein
MSAIVLFFVDHLFAVAGLAFFIRGNNLFCKYWVHAGEQEL